MSQDRILGQSRTPQCSNGSAKSPGDRFGHRLSKRLYSRSRRGNASAHVFTADSKFLFAAHRLNRSIRTAQEEPRPVAGHHQRERHVNPLHPTQIGLGQKHFPVPPA